MAYGPGDPYYAEMAPQIYDSYGLPQVARPQRPDLLDNSGLLRPQFQSNTNYTGDIEAKLAGLKSPGYDAYSQMALSQGFSPWVGLQTDQLRQEAGRQRGAVDASAQGAYASGVSQLGQSGGVRGGARERLAKAAQLQAMQAKQGINANLGNQIGGVYQQDVQNRQNMLAALPGMEQNRNQFQINAWAAARAQDEQNKINDRNLALQTAQNFYNQDMSEYGANQTANAQIIAARNQNHGGCFITTAVVDWLKLPDDGHLMFTLRKFRDEYLKTNPIRNEDVKEYYEIAPEIVKKVQMFPEGVQGYVWNTAFDKYIVPCYHMILDNRLEAAHTHYKELVTWLKDAVKEAA